MKHQNNIDQFIQLIADVVTAVRELGREATQLGTPFGVRGHGARVRGFVANDPLPQLEWERPIVEDAGRILGSALRYPVVFRSTDERLRYPSYVVSPPRKGNPSRGGFPTSDLKIEIAPGKWFWIEAKTAYLHDLTVARHKAPDWSGTTAKNAWLTTRNGLLDIANCDVSKLRQLRSNDAHAIGVLLIAFDRVNDPLGTRHMESTFLTSIADFEAAHRPLEGVTYPDSYPIREKNGYRERFWLWYRLVA